MNFEENRQSSYSAEAETVDHDYPPRHVGERTVTISAMLSSVGNKPLTIAVIRVRFMSRTERLVRTRDGDREGREVVEPTIEDCQQLPTTAPTK